MKYWKLLALISLGVASLNGCSKPSIVTGEVKFEDGSPLMYGRVNFEPTEGAVGFWGQLTEDGTFAVDPALTPHAGEYVVTLAGASSPEVFEDDPKGQSHKVKFPSKPLVDAKKYGDAKASPLKATIEPGKNELTFTVDRLP
ncbi:MAG: hypothetical protein JWN70_1468 [Planctomycetaceae bacterium]|nr:hypothetical protein [Planctomycetaceae bacterium]